MLCFVSVCKLHINIFLIDDFKPSGDSYMVVCMGKLRNVREKLFLTLHVELGTIESLPYMMAQMAFLPLPITIFNASCHLHHWMGEI